MRAKSRWMIFCWKNRGNMKRFDDESYDDYKLRQKQDKLRTKERKRGKMIHQSTSQLPDGRMFSKTYRKERVEN